MKHISDIVNSKLFWITCLIAFVVGMSTTSITDDIGAVLLFAFSSFLWSQSYINRFYSDSPGYSAKWIHAISITLTGASLISIGPLRALLDSLNLYQMSRWWGLEYYIIQLPLGFLCLIAGCVFISMLLCNEDKNEIESQ